MAFLRRPAGGPRFDVTLVLGEQQGTAAAAAAAVEAQAPAIVRHLAIKGFCVASLEMDSAVLDSAVRQIERLPFHDTAPALAEGLLGWEGSARTAPVPREDSSLSEGALLPFLARQLEGLVRQLGGRTAEALGFDLLSQTEVLAHETGEQAARGSVALDLEEAVGCLDTFVRHRLMAVLFLGPAKGSLELRLAEAEGAEPWQVATSAGTLVILRPDLLARSHASRGLAGALSCFGLAAAPHPRARAASRRQSSATRGLDVAIASHIEFLKEQATHSVPLWPLPGIARREPQAPLSTSVPVESGACRFPCGEELDGWFQAAASTGPDYAGEVPALRWDHGEVYDPGDESWLCGRSYCRHASFMDGIELFDARTFEIPVEQARSMDPHHRLILEVGYSALYRTGRGRNSLVNFPCAVYVGLGNNEWMFVPSKDTTRPLRHLMGATGFSAAASRLSFVLGLAGPSLALDTEASSGLAALHLATEATQPTAQPRSEHAVAVGTHLCLSPTYWPSLCASRWLSRKGRCLAFDASADGYVRGEGCAAAVVGELGGLGGEAPILGFVAGARTLSTPAGAGLRSPHGPAEQEILAEALRSACVSPLDVGCAQAHAAGCSLGDAVELDATVRVLRQCGSGSEPLESLMVGAVKSSCGNQVECGGLASFLAALLTTQRALMAPNLHLQQANSHIDVLTSSVVLCGEATELAETSTYVGVKSRGFGGSIVCVVAWGQLSQERAPLPQPPPEASLVFWPGGGGELDREERPLRAYTVAGTWARWRHPEGMEFEGAGTYGCTVALGENAWELFQIWLDGDPERALHPRQPRAGPDSMALGPAGAEEALRLRWRLGGGEEDRPGDRYRIRLRVAGRWRAVSWERLGLAPPGGGAAAEPASSAVATYAVACGWKAWQLQEMRRIPDEDGVYRADVRLPWDGAGDFQIVRNDDWEQVFHPAAAADPGRSPGTAVPGAAPAVPAAPAAGAGDGGSSVDGGAVAGPDDGGPGRCWQLRGTSGEAFRIELRRWREGGADRKRVSWQRLSEPSGVACDVPRLCAVGSWDDWERVRELSWDPAARRFTFELNLGPQGEESFQLLQDGLWEKAIVPSLRGATPHSFHVLLGPRPCHHGVGVSWAVGRHPRDEGRPGARYLVEVHTGEGAKPTKVMWTRREPD